MLALLQDLHSLLLTNPQLERELAELAFVPTLCGQLVAPRELYDPRNTHLAALLDPSKSFPDRPYDDEEVSRGRQP